MTAIMDVIRAIRNIRGERACPRQKISAILFMDEGKPLDPGQPGLCEAVGGVESLEQCPRDAAKPARPSRPSPPASKSTCPLPTWWI